MATTLAGLKKPLTDIREQLQQCIDSDEAS